jgi:hypothetical protein
MEISRDEQKKLKSEMLLRKFFLTHSLLIDLELERNANSSDAHFYGLFSKNSSWKLKKDFF